MCLGCSDCLPLKWRACLLFSFPLVYAAALAIIPLWVNDPLGENLILSCSCVAFASVNLLTFLIGEAGVFCRLEAALRATLVLLIMENVMTFFLSAFALLELGRRHFPAKNPEDWRLPPRAVLFEIAAAAALCLLPLASGCCLWVVAEFQAELDAESFAREACRLKKGERTPLLRSFPTAQQSPQGTRSERPPAKQQLLSPSSVAISISPSVP